MLFVLITMLNSLNPSEPGNAGEMEETWKYIPRVPNVRPAGQMQPLEALYLAPVIIGLSECRPFSSITFDRQEA